MKIKAVALISGFCLLSALLMFVNSGNGSIKEVPLEVSTASTNPSNLEASWMTHIVKPKNGIEPVNVFSFECELVLNRPDLMTTNCADFGEVVRDIKWKTWSAEGAVGTGIYSVNDCNPDCADGTRHEEPVFVQLKDLTTDGKKYYLNTLMIFESSGDSRPTDGTEWDVSEYFRTTLR